MLRSTSLRRTARRSAWQLVAAAGLASAPALAQTADLTVDGQPSIQLAPMTSGTLFMTGAANSFAVLALDVDPGPTLVGGTSVPLGLTPALTLLPFTSTNGSGVATWTLGIPVSPPLAGTTIYFGGAIADPLAPGGLAVSNGASIDIVDAPALAGDELAGRPLATFPGFTNVDVFQTGDTIEVSVDATAHPFLAGKTVDVYLVEAKNATQWANDASLVDASSDGAETVQIGGGTYADNAFAIEPGNLPGSTTTRLGEEYDVVIDTNRNGVLDATDVIDGLGDETGLYVTPDLGAPGPFAVSSKLYTSGPSNWTDQKVYWPSNIASLGLLPVVHVSHGNGHNYQWYDHLGEHLASWGFVVTSHRNNTVPGVQSAASSILENLEYFFASTGAVESALVGHVDDTRIGLIGHSRGGEGVAIAYHRLFTGAVTPSSYDISGIRIVSSIAPTYFEGDTATVDNVHDVPFHLWVGGADADVNGCTNFFGGSVAAVMGHWGWALGERTMINLQGAGHGAFHDGGGSTVSSGPCLLTRPEVHTIMRPHALALFSHYLRLDPAAPEFLWREWTDLRPIGTTTDPCAIITQIHTENDPSKSFILDDFESNSSRFVASSGAAVSFSVGNVSEGPLTDGTNFSAGSGEAFNTFAHGTGGEPTNGVVFSFGANPSQFFRYELPAGMRDVSAYEQLSFAMAQQSRDANTIALADELGFTVRVLDGSGNAASITATSYGDGIGQPYQRSGCGSGTGWATEFETFRIPLADFTRDGTGVDLTDLRYIAFFFGSSHGGGTGRVGLDQVEFVVR